MEGEKMKLRVNDLESSTQRVRLLPNWVRLMVVCAWLPMVVSCGSSVTAAPTSAQATPTLWLMPVADLGVSITVDDFDAALERLDFVEELGGRITAVDISDYRGTEQMTVEFRVPHEYTEHVANVLRTEFGEVTYISVLASDVSVRNMRLRRELASLEESLDGLSGTELAEARERIQLLQDSIAFQIERATYLFVMLHLVEAQQEGAGP